MAEPRTSLVLIDAPRSSSPPGGGAVLRIASDEVVAGAVRPDCALQGGRAGDLELVWLPVDGPEAAFRLVVEGLPTRLGAAATRTVVLIGEARGPPARPRWVRLVAAAGLVPGIDLSRFRFATPTSAWLTGVDRLVGIELALSRPRNAGQLADALTALRVIDPTFPGYSWIEAVASGREVPDVDDWADVLQAHYVHVIARAG